MMVSLISKKFQNMMLSAMVRLASRSGNRINHNKTSSYAQRIND